MSRQSTIVDPFPHQPPLLQAKIVVTEPARHLLDRATKGLRLSTGTFEKLAPDRAAHPGFAVTNTHVDPEWVAEDHRTVGTTGTAHGTPKPR